MTAAKEMLNIDQFIPSVEFDLKSIRIYRVATAFFLEHVIYKLSPF